jgi:hypothetical protein
MGLAKTRDFLDRLCARLGISASSGTTTPYPKFLNKIRVSKIVTRYCVQAFRVRAIRVRVRVFQVQASGLGFYAHREYKHKAHGTTSVLPNFRPLEEKPYVLIVVCIDDEFTKSPRFSMD